MASTYPKKLFASLHVFSLLYQLSNAIALPGTIERVTKQQILATVPPTGDAGAGSGNTPEPFITSPSEKYAAYLVRTKTAPAAGGFGNDFCYVQVEDTSSSQSVWESECMPISDANACTLVFDDAGLELFDGSNSVWSTEADGNHVNILELVDEGDMRIIDKDGELAWKATDVPRVNQECGLPGSAGLAPASPPFANPIGGGNVPFGQQQQQPINVGLGQQQQQSTVAAPGVAPVVTPAAAEAPTDVTQTLANPPPDVTPVPEYPPTDAGGEQQQPTSVSPVSSPAGLGIGQQPTSAGVSPAASGPAGLGGVGQQNQQPTNVGLGPAATSSGIAGGPEQQPQIDDTLPAGGVASQNGGVASQTGGEPLVDNTPYDSGSSKGSVSWLVVVAVALPVSFLCGF